MLFKGFTMVYDYLIKNSKLFVNSCQAIFSFLYLSKKRNVVEKYHFIRAWDFHKKTLCPGQARLDAPGTLHHVMIRGIDCLQIFRDDQDRENSCAAF